jgi:hypothetical protein
VHQEEEAASVQWVEEAPGVEAVSHEVAAEVLPQEAEAVREAVSLVVADEFLHPWCTFVNFKAFSGSYMAIGCRSAVVREWIKVLLISSLSVPTTTEAMAR